MFEKNCILIVEDSLAGRNLLIAILKREGYRIEFASTGREALEKTFEIKPDLVLLDVMLPDMDGFEVCSMIRNNPYTSLMPVIMVTALDDRASKLKGLQSGADEFLSKPLDPLEVKARVSTVLKLDRFRRLLYDRTTGLPNELLFIDYIDSVMIKKNKKGMTQFAVHAVKLSNSMFLNNYLSEINDQKMLKDLLNNFQNGRDDVKIISYNREGYFTIILDEAGANKAIKFAEDIVNAFSKPVKYLDGEMLLSCVIGISLYPENGSSGNELINNARLAYENDNNSELVQLKLNIESSVGDSTPTEAEYGDPLPHEEVGVLRLDKFHIRFFDKDLEQICKNNVEIAANLYNAIDKKEFILNFQPQVRVYDREIKGMEALIRWDSEKYGLVFPDFFIPRAEENGTIISLDNWVIENSMKYLCRINQINSITTNVSINVSALQFEDPSLESKIVNLTNVYDLKPERITIEITESSIMANFEESQKRMRSLKEKGFKLSIDDFGTGQASLAYLKDYPVDEIKIDKVFIQNLVNVKVDYEIVKHIIDLAHTLNMITVAEGVEEERQVELLESLGCDVIQGYFFSKPVGEDEMRELLLTQPFRKPVFENKIYKREFLSANTAS